ncbi:hypothetical protein pdam_00001664 [Pocillopora damicornis]|uniref:U3 small nucleolar RNA-associated protein 18 homolog n=1 Tax=Pocillopora damicornis TaxID=46731 RepID=A0A3M6UPU2_POCDA|nr:hypothetical protein pdam_00001664 [Pocillopora damicornis]
MPKSSHGDVMLPFEAYKKDTPPECKTLITGFLERNSHAGRITTYFEMLKRKVRSHLGKKCSEETPIKVKKQTLASETEDDEAERTLERLVFGGEGDVIKEIEKDLAEDRVAFSSNDERCDTRYLNVVLRLVQCCSIEIEITSMSRLKKLRDTEDETVITGKKYTQKLKQQFQKIYGDASWADLDKKKRKDSLSEDEEEDLILQRAGNLLTKKANNLPRGILDIKRIKDANIEKPSNATLQCVEFHPSAKVLLTAGFNKTLDLFQIDGQTNPKLQSVFLERFPIHTAHFSSDGEQVILASQRRSFYVYDMIKGEVIKIPEIRGREERYFDKFHVSPDGKHLIFLGTNGYIILLSSKTKQWIGNLKMNGSVQSVAFNADGSRMFTAGDDGEVYIWDMNTRSCVHKFRDEGCLNSTSLAASRDGQYLACGSDSGVVNIYDNQRLDQTQPKPLKAIMNLTTSINNRDLGDVFKSEKGFVHLPSLSVFSNWPTSRTSLRYVNAFDFSPNSGYLSIGNDRGKALLYRLNHFTDS